LRETRQPDLAGTEENGVELSYPVAVGGLAALTAGGIGAAFLLGVPRYAWVVVPIVGVLAVLYLYTYSKRPGPETEPPGTPGEEEPFVDPVEEADQAATPPAGPGPGSTGEEPFDDPVEEADAVDSAGPAAPAPKAPEAP
jgi:hypothetical protein